MIPLTVPLPIATSIATIPVNEDQFIEVGAQLELYRGILQDHTQHLDAMPPTLFAKIDRDVKELYTKSREVRDKIFSQRYRFRSLKHEQEKTVIALQRELQEMRDHVSVLEQKGDRRERGFWHVRCESMSSDSTAPLSPDHPLTHTTPILVPILRRTTCMAMRVSSVMSPGLSTGMAEVAAMPDSTFCKRFRSSYDSSPSPTLPVRKRYRGTSELILGTDSEEDEEVKESLDSNSESVDIEDESPTEEDEDPTAEDEGLTAGVEGPSVDDGSYGLDGESHGVDDESHGLDDEIYRINGEGHGIESDGLGLGEEEAVPND
uniref:Uncharacterized protein n=1 Tax=Tanacetum cinerariifolium TaxID=118510 RepID=A0A6L2NM06_TANCI|nr:hypothetical protein [Tanacetum cinerariifolium]